ncbi:hypothetical protein [Roseomonas sp. BN140053]|uniref:hypothetical protein n=1 Tax=Roseomonas sp. BN140053 TaxID=3391898 RepID=UPI0039E799CB
MSDGPDDRVPPVDTETLQRRKLQAEVTKLEVEVPKLRNDNRLLNRHASALVSIAAVVVSGMSLLNGYVASREQAERTEIERRESEKRTAAAAEQAAQREEAEVRRLAAERSIHCVELGMRVADFTREQVRAAGQQDRPGVELIANTVIGLFPPAEAAAILRAVRVNLSERVMREPAVQARWDDILDRLEDGVPAGCERARDLRLALPAARPDTPVPAPAAAATVPAVPPTAGSCPELGPPAVGAARLLVFTQIVQGADRDAARRILERAATLEPGFNRAPIEDIRARNPDAQRPEVRYYFADQSDEAERLIAVVRRAACLEGLSTPLEGLRATYIGNRFQNLPRADSERTESEGLPGSGAI